MILFSFSLFPPPPAPACRATPSSCVNSKRVQGKTRWRRDGKKKQKTKQTPLRGSFHLPPRIDCPRADDKSASLPTQPRSEISRRHITFSSQLQNNPRSDSSADHTAYVAARSRDRLAHFPCLSVLKIQDLWGQREGAKRIHRSLFDDPFNGRV